MRDVHDLIGVPPKRVSQEQKLREHLEARRARDEAPSLHVSDIHAGVPVSWFAQIFGMDPSTVKRRLADCPPLHRRKSGYVYSVVAALPYLMKPKVDIAKLLETMKESDLPPHLQRGYWDSKIKRQNWEREAGQLYRKEAVVALFGETAQAIKHTIQLWADNLERQVGLSPGQRTILLKLTDQLQDNVYARLVKQSKGSRTLPIAAEETPETPKPPKHDVRSLI